MDVDDRQQRGEDNRERQGDNSGSNNSGSNGSNNNGGNNNNNNNNGGSNNNSGNNNSSNNNNSGNNNNPQSSNGDTANRQEGNGRDFDFFVHPELLRRYNNTVVTIETNLRLVQETNPPQREKEDLLANVRAAQVDIYRDVFMATMVNIISSDVRSRSPDATTTEAKKAVFAVDLLTNTIQSFQAKGEPSLLETLHSRIASLHFDKQLQIERAAMNFAQALSDLNGRTIVATNFFGLALEFVKQSVGSNADDPIFAMPGIGEVCPEDMVERDDLMRSSAIMDGMKKISGALTTFLAKMKDTSAVIVKLITSAISYWVTLRSFADEMGLEAKLQFPVDTDGNRYSQTEFVATMAKLTAFYKHKNSDRVAVAAVLCILFDKTTQDRLGSTFQIKQEVPSRSFQNLVYHFLKTQNQGLNTLRTIFNDLLMSLRVTVSIDHLKETLGYFAAKRLCWLAYREGNNNSTTNFANYVPRFEDAAIIFKRFSRDQQERVALIQASLSNVTSLRSVAETPFFTQKDAQPIYNNTYERMPTYTVLCNSDVIEFETIHRDGITFNLVEYLQSQRLPHGNWHASSIDVALVEKILTPLDLINDDFHYWKQFIDLTRTTAVFQDVVVFASLNKLDYARRETSPQVSQLFAKEAVRLTNEAAPILSPGTIQIAQATSVDGENTLQMALQQSKLFTAMTELCTAAEKSAYYVDVLLGNYETASAANVDPTTFREIGNWCHQHTNELRESYKKLNKVSLQFAETPLWVVTTKLVEKISQFSRLDQEAIVRNPAEIEFLLTKALEQHVEKSRAAPALYTAYFQFLSQFSWVRFITAKLYLVLVTRVNLRPDPTSGPSSAYASRNLEELKLQSKNEEYARLDIKSIIADSKNPSFRALPTGLNTTEEGFLNLLSDANIAVQANRSTVDRNTIHFIAHNRFFYYLAHQELRNETQAPCEVAKWCIDMDENYEGSIPSILRRKIMSGDVNLCPWISTTSKIDDVSVKQALFVDWRSLTISPADNGLEQYQALQRARALITALVSDVSRLDLNARPTQFLEMANFGRIGALGILGGAAVLLGAAALLSATVTAVASVSASINLLGLPLLILAYSFSDYLASAGNFAVNLGRRLPQLFGYGYTPTEVFRTAQLEASYPIELLQRYNPEGAESVQYGVDAQAQASLQARATAEISLSWVQSLIGYSRAMTVTSSMYGIAWNFVGPWSRQSFVNRGPEWQSFYGGLLRFAQLNNHWRTWAPLFNLFLAVWGYFTSVAEVTRQVVPRSAWRKFSEWLDDRLNNGEPTFANFAESAAGFVPEIDEATSNFLKRTVLDSVLPPTAANHFASTLESDIRANTGIWATLSILSTRFATVGVGLTGVGLGATGISQFVNFLGRTFFSSRVGTYPQVTQRIIAEGNIAAAERAAAVLRPLRPLPPPPPAAGVAPAAAIANVLAGLNPPEGARDFARSTFNQARTLAYDAVVSDSANDTPVQIAERASIIILFEMMARWSIGDYA